MPMADIITTGKTGLIPNLKMNRWDEECYIQVIAPLKGASMSREGNKIKWRNSKAEVHLYPIERQLHREKDHKGREHVFIQNENGGYELESILLEKPASNILTFHIETQGLKFYYQPELTQEEIDRGAFRPENVVGSYAVYHASRTNVHSNKEDALKYKAGKAFHIYRPKAIDDAGNEIWGDLHIDEQKGTLSVTIDQGWLDAAIYPVRVDPNFGYEVAGGSSKAIIENIRGSVFTITEEGTGSSITFYAQSWGDDVDAKLAAAIYLHSDSSLVGSTTPVDIGTTDQLTQWWTTNFASPPSLTASTAYVLVAWGDDYSLSTLYYDAGDVDQGHDDAGVWTYGDPPPWPNPAVFVHNTDKYSVYCTYSIPGVGHPTQLRTRRIPGMNLIGGL